MDRFSHSQTLSNSKTAVRETVDFVNKVMLAMFFAVIALAVPITARAQTTTVPASETLESKMKALDKYCAGEKANSEECKTAKRLAGIDGTDRLARECEKAEDQLRETTAKAKTSCSNAGIADLSRCYIQIKTCHDEEASLDELDEADEGGRQPFCDRIMANKCSGLSTFMTGRNYRDEKRDAEKDRLEAKKEVDAILNDQKDLKKDLVQQQRELQEEQMKSAYAQREQEREIANNMKEALAGIGDNQKKAFDDIQKAYNQIDADYIGMRAQIQAAADAVAQAEEELQTQCRAAAERKYAEAEKARKAELAKRSKNVGNNVSGSTARKKAATARQRNIDYTAYLTECTAGVSAEGSSARSKIAAAQRAKASTEKLMNEKAALIEKQRAQMLKKLQDMEGDATNQQSQVIEKVNEQLTAMNEKQQLTAQINQQRIAEFQQNQTSAMQSLQERLNTANQELMRTQQEASLATTRESCAGNNAQRSESKREKVEEGFQSAVSSIDDLNDVCRKKIRICGAQTTENVKTVDICSAVSNIVQGKTSSGKRATKPEVRSSGTSR